MSEVKKDSGVGKVMDKLSAKPVNAELKEKYGDI